MYEQLNHEISVLANKVGVHDLPGDPASEMVRVVGLMGNLKLMGEKAVDMILHKIPFDRDALLSFSTEIVDAVDPTIAPTSEVQDAIILTVKYLTLTASEWEVDSADGLMEMISDKSILLIGHPQTASIVRMVVAKLEGGDAITATVLQTIARSMN